MNMQATLKNFSLLEYIGQIFPFTQGFELSKKGVIRAIAKPDCSCCGEQCIRNGWELLTRKNLVSVKIGKFYCNDCNITIGSDLSFWERLIGQWEETVSHFLLHLADRDLALRVMSDLMHFLVPMSKDSVLRRIVNTITKLVIPQVKTKYQIVHYDEQHPKKGRQQKYRLTLICAISGNVIADELVEEKNSESIKNFLTTHLDTNKETIIITDDCPWYPTVFSDVWGKKVKHQLCILHLNKLIVKDTGKTPTIQEMYNTYLFLNIFFDRSAELQFLQTLIKEEEQNKEWLKKARKRFNTFVRTLEKMRRREKKNHTLQTLEQAKSNFAKLQKEKQFFSKPFQKRIEYIKNRWNQFTLFHNTKDCPHTNNIIENYFSTSLKTHRKKQFRTNKGLANKMKLSQYKRNVGFPKPTKTFFDWIKLFISIGT